jgi:D-alanyl-D-alanine carboxypeptidase
MPVLMSLPRRTAFAIALFATASTSADAQTAVDALRARLQAKLDSVHANARFPGATLGVVLPDGRSFGIAVGHADTAKHEVMRADHRMLQGSVGKTYVAAVALQLVRDGKLDLDAKISTYLGREPWWQDASGNVRLPNGADITVRQLMTHTSGVVRYEFQDAFHRDLMQEPQREWQPGERLRYVLDSAPPFAAGQGWEHSDTNYILLGIIIEQLTGRALFTEVRERLLVPFELRNTIPSDRSVRRRLDHRTCASSAAIPESLCPRRARDPSGKEYDENGDIGF